MLLEKNNHRKDDADRLCKYGCKCCARCVHVQTGNQNEVADDVDDTCDEDEQERRFAVAKSAENRRQKVVGDDEENPAAADTNITCRQSDCFSRSLHEYRDGTGKENHRCEQADRKQCEYNRRAADDGADLFRVLFPIASCVTTKVTRFNTWLPVETADSPEVEPNLPTTSRSTAP